MTRLTEALERARAAASEGTTRLVPKAAENPSRSGSQGSAWEFDEDSLERAVASESEVELPTSRTLDPARSAPIERETEPSHVHGARPAQAHAVRQQPIRGPEVTTDLRLMKLASADLGKLVLAQHANPNTVEQYRAVAASVHHAQLQTGARALMVSSAVVGEGKTLTSTNLALTLSHSYQRRVLLIDADLRRPSVHQVLRLDNHVGLGDTLKQAHPNGALPVQRLLPTLWVMTAGQPNSDPMGALVSEAMKTFLADAAEQFDWVVIDTPPVALLPDANLLAAMVDTALLVVSAGTTPYGLVTRAIDAIGRSRILGVVLNRAEEKLKLGYDHLSYAYGPLPKATRRARFGL